MRVRMVWKLVRVPPSQRWLTYPHPAAVCLALDHFLGLPLGADEQDLAAVGDQLHHVLVGIVDHAQRLLQVDDVDAVALGEDIALHGGVPATGLVPEMHPCFQQRFHVDGFPPRRLRGPFRHRPGRLSLPHFGGRCRWRGLRHRYG